MTNASARYKMTSPGAIRSHTGLERYAGNDVKDGAAGVRCSAFVSSQDHPSHSN